MPGYHHAVAIGITYGTRKVHVLYFLGICLLGICILCNGKKAYRTSKFEVMFNVSVCCSVYLYSQLVERVVVAFAHVDRIPGIATLYLALHTDGFSLSAESFLLAVVFYFEQQPLLNEFMVHVG